MQQLTNGIRAAKHEFDSLHKTSHSYEKTNKLSSSLRNPKHSKTVSDSSNTQSHVPKEMDATNSNLLSSQQNFNPNENLFLPPEIELYERKKLKPYLRWGSQYPLGAGLMNLGATCFMDASLQCLAYTPPLLNWLFSKEHSSRSRSCVQPSIIAKNLPRLNKGLRLGRQEDAHEFIRGALESAHSKLLPKTKVKIPPKVEATTVIHQIFGGYLQSQVRCAKCGHESNTFDPFLDISLELTNCKSIEECLARYTKAEILDEDNQYKCESCGKMSCARKQMTIREAPQILVLQLMRFKKSGMGLFGGGNNRKDYYQRSKDRNLSKNRFSKVKIVHSPSRGSERVVKKMNLFPRQSSHSLFSSLHLFSDRSFGKKIEKHISFSLSLNLQPFMSFSHTASPPPSKLSSLSFRSPSKSVQPSDSSSSQTHLPASASSFQYNLFGVVVHDGPSTRSGHYYAYVKAPDNNWYEADDSRVRAVSASKVLHSEAYVLFYSLNGERPNVYDTPIKNGEMSEMKKEILSEGKSFVEAFKEKEKSIRPIIEQIYPIPSNDRIKEENESEENESSEEQEEDFPVNTRKRRFRIIEEIESPEDQRNRKLINKKVGNETDARPVKTNEILSSFDTEKSIMPLNLKMNEKRKVLTSDIMPLASHKQNNLLQPFTTKLDIKENKTVKKDNIDQTNHKTKRPRSSIIRSTTDESSTSTATSFSLPSPSMSPCIPPELLLPDSFRDEFHLKEEKVDESIKNSQKDKVNISKKEF
eukprot:MONOS_8520.1-p1 / transcript=MONOS_8520.1 / gene=MONOS_8520 / organism=Monocercomonoides_exilis_PA203 / gene_product=Ubiquitin carboxyl-terminal hydrolase 36 / transcript_product=Ubiquitin carboxyl-terminal hydrolase 36 / location=Mono_scaffold00323:52834-55595(+) / protein_length=754 / sequence_SO=supercontig / SO=protein_coding / is_pseudo=false